MLVVRYGVPCMLSCQLSVQKALQGQPGSQAAPK